MKAYSILSLGLVIHLIVACQSKPSEKSHFEIPEGKQAKQTTYYFVRHAEKDTTNPEHKDPKLNTKGEQRANYLAEYFADKSLDAFYTTDFERTIKTLEPTAKSYQENMVLYDVPEDSLFTHEFWKTTYGKKVLVVGHSNTSPRFVNEILRKTTYQPLNESNYDVFFKVEIDKDLTVKDTLLTMNVPQHKSSKD